MLDDRTVRARVHDALDDCLSGVDAMPSFRYDIMRKVRGETVVKKKVSLGLVFAIVLLLVTVAAVAATILWENYAAQVKQTEHEQGSYANWQVKDKIELIRVLTDNGHIEESDATNQLFSENVSEFDAHRIADRLIMEMTRVADVQDINLDVITYSIMGFIDTWMPEQRVWWQQITNMYRHPDMIENDTFVTSGPKDITEREAVEIARQAIISANALPEDYFDKNARAIADLYVTEQRPDYRRWNVIFNVYRDGSDYLVRGYGAVVDNTGAVIADPDVGRPLPGGGMDKTMDELTEEKGHYIFWTHEERAKHMPERFAMPATDAISEDEAIRIAWEAARSEEKIQPINLDGFAPYAMYGAAIPDNPLNPNDYWVATLAINLTKDYTTEREVNVYMDARTGEVFNIF